MSLWIHDLISKSGLSKSLFSIENGHHCVFNGTIIIHEDIYMRSPQKLISRLQSLSGENLSSVFARNTEVVEIDKEVATEFLNANHLLGFKGGKTFLGLKDDTELVAIAVFSKILFMKYENPPYYSVELERYCSLQGYTVVGGLDKLIQGYLQRNVVDDMVTYIDKEWSDGSSYLKLGFEIIGETEPLTFELDPKTWERKLVRNNDNKTASVHHKTITNKGNLKLRLRVNQKQD